MVDLFDDYRFPGRDHGPFDEMFDSKKSVRPSYGELHKVLSQMTTEVRDSRSVV